MNTPTPHTHQPLEIMIHDHGDLKRLYDFIDGHKESFGIHYNQIRESIEHIDSSSLDQSELDGRIQELHFMKNLSMTLKSGIGDLTGFSELRHLQKLSLSGFINFLIWSREESQKTGYIVIPTGQGKTLISLLIGILNPQKSIIITDNNQGKSQFLRTAQSFHSHQQQIDEIQTKTNNHHQLLTGGWQNFLTAVEGGYIDFSHYSLIIIDEADVNGLSPHRQSILTSISSKHLTKIVGVTATEQQRNRELSDYYLYDILRFPMPGSLPELYALGELPNTRFIDVYLQGDLSLHSKPFGDALDEGIDSFIETTPWIDQIFSYHLTHNPGKKFVLGMRNNRLNELILLQAQKFGLRLMVLDQNVAPPDRQEIIEKLVRGEIDGIVGSRLTGRGLDLPECEVVYNSLLTYSPQLFWQLAGRGIRLDKNNLQKQAQLITFLPKRVLLDESKKEGGKAENKNNYMLPLCFEGFLDRSFFTKERNFTDETKDFLLEELNAQDIKSIEEINNYLNCMRNYGSFTGRPELLTNIIRLYHGHISMKILIDYILKIRGTHTQKYFQSEILTRGPITTEEQQEYDMLLSRYAPLPSQSLSMIEEKKLVELYFDPSTPREKQLSTRNTLLSHHYPIIIALALNYNKRVKTNPEDLIQAGVAYVIEKLNVFRTTHNRFSGYCAIYALSGMTRHFRNYEELVPIPIYLQDLAKKVTRTLDEQERTQGFASGEQKKHLVSQVLQDQQKSTQKRIEQYLDREYVPYNDQVKTDLTDSVLESILREEIRHHLSRAQDSLRPKEVQTLQEYFWEEQSYSQIAKRYQVTPQAINARIKKILRILANRREYEILRELGVNDDE